MAERALCKRDKCGAVIVADGAIIGEGYNSPPRDEVDHERCTRKHELAPDFKSDKTCCPHAEWRAVFDALRHHPERIAGSTIYFTRVDATGAFIPSGKPYCTSCSKMVLDVGVGTFALWHPEGIKLYETHEYNDLSFQWTA